MLRAALLLALLAPGRADSSEAPEDRLARGVVRIYSVVRKPDYYQPWQMGPEEGFSGTGSLISGGRILTNAHVVADAVFVEARKPGDPRRYPARVEFIANDSELALLAVEDPAFPEGTTRLELGPLPKRRDRVAVYGFPVGGEDLSVTEGIVSRVEVTEYAHSGRELLTLQTDASIDSGNSGGPLIKDGRIAGITFQMDAEGGKAGYAVPSPVIARFLKDVEDGRYDGLPDLGVRWENAENAAKRDLLGLRPSDTGVRVAAVAYGSSAWGVLETGDILLSLDGVPIHDDGTVPLRRGERAEFKSLLHGRQIGESVAVTVLRGGKERRLSVTLKPEKSLVSGPDYGVRPTYFVHAGLIFTPLTRNYLSLWDYAQVSTPLRFYYEYGLPTAERQEVVLLSHVLADAVNAGYHDIKDLPVASINGRRIAGMRDAVAAFSAPRGRHHVIELEPDAPWRGLIVLDAAEAKAASPGIVARYGLPADRSPDLR